MRTSESSPPVFFRVPPIDKRFGVLPKAPSEYWKWVSEQPELDAWGPFSWTLQTYLQLQTHGFPVQLTREIPDEGIVIAHRDFIPDSLVPTARQFLVCILADRGEPGFGGRHPWAQFHIVQNRHDPLLDNPHEDWPAAYMPYWPQPGMVPRDPRRGEQFSNAAFVGYQHNLAPELRDGEWAARLSELGLHWTIPHRSQWHDYSAIDVVVAARSFGTGLEYPGKPPSKLHNAWLAGVPAVLGRESAFQSVRRSEHDYIEVDSVGDALAAVKRLRESPDLRSTMVKNGVARAEDLRPDALSAQWYRLIAEVLTPASARWSTLDAEARERFLDARRARRINGLAAAPEGVYVPQVLSGADGTDGLGE